MVNMISVDELVRQHGIGKIKMIDSFSEDNNLTYEKEYTCMILDDLGNHVIRISMPIEYGEVVPLPLDSHYEMEIETNVGNYFTKGIIINRYRNEKGNVMDFKMIQPIAYVNKLKFPTIETNIQSSYTLHNSTEKNLGNITKLSMQHLTMETYGILEEGTKLDIVFSLNGGENIVLSGEVKESVRINVQQYENQIKLYNVDFLISETLAKWMIK